MSAADSQHSHPNPSSLVSLSSSSPLHSSTKSGSRANSKKKKWSKFFPHFPKYFIQKKKPKKILAKQPLEAQIIEDQVLDLQEEKRTHSQSPVHSNIYKLSLEANLDLLGVSFTQIQAPPRSSK